MPVLAAGPKSCPGGAVYCLCTAAHSEGPTIIRPPSQANGVNFENKVKRVSPDDLSDFFISNLNYSVVGDRLTFMRHERLLRGR